MVQCSRLEGSRNHLRARRPVKPFVLVGVGVVLEERDITSSIASRDTDTDEWSGRAALGVEWFPVAPLSLTAWTGLRITRFAIQYGSPGSPGSPDGYDGTTPHGGPAR